jgi:hypothetical protein
VQNFWGLALHWFLFFFCVDVVGTSDGVKLLKVEDKRWQPFEAKALLHYHVFCVFFYTIVFVVVAFKGRLPKM